MIGSRLIKSNNTAAGCEDIVDNYDPFGGNGVALYQLNGNANDVSGNYDGVFTNPAYGTGVFGQAGVFNGSSSYITATGLGITGNTSFSVSVWIKTTSSGVFFFFGNGALNASFYIEANSGGNIRVGEFDFDLFTSAQTVNDGGWHNIVFTSDSITSKLYIDGSQTNSVANTFNISADIMEIGRGTSSYYFNGSIDQVRVFNTALTPLEIEALYTEELCICGGTVDTLDILGDGSCIATYQLDGNANDLSGNYSGTPTDVSYGVGEFDLAGVFNGSTSSINTGFAQNTSNAFSWSFWFNGNSTQAAIPLIIDTTSSTSPYPGIGVGYEGGTAYVFISGGTVVPGASVSPNTWAHVVLTHDGSGNFSFYVNNTPIFTNISRISNLYSGQNILLGNTTVWNKFNGSIDQVRIFNKALSPEEVTTLYDETACAVANPLDEASFHYDPKTIVSDGTITTWADSGSFNRSLYLASGFTKATVGGIEYITSTYNSGGGRTMFAGNASPTSYSDYSTQQNFTIGTFMNVSSAFQTTTAYPYGFTLGPAWGGTSDYASEFVQFAARYGWGGGLDYYSYFTFRSGTTTKASAFTLSQQPYPSWHFICHSVNYNPSGTSIVKSYFDGNLIKTTTFTGIAGASSNILGLGSSYVNSEARGGISFGNSFGFMGTTLTDSEVATIWTTLKGDYGL